MKAKHNRDTGDESDEVEAPRVSDRPPSSFEHLFDGYGEIEGD